MLHLQNITICKFKGKKTQNGYRQLGLIGNFVSPLSPSDCRKSHYRVGDEYGNCVVQNDQMNHQNIMALSTKVLELTKMNKVLEKR